METIGFGPLTIQFDERVLRPRPWTALQSRWAAELLAVVPDGPVLELCSGAGHIGLLAAHESDRDLVLVDADPVACHHARENVRNSLRASYTEVRCAPLETAIHDDERFALVVADPPWVESARTADYPEDPLTAIDGGDDGLSLARACLRVAGAHLVVGGSLVLQVGTVAQAEALSEWLPTQPELDLDPVEVRDVAGSGTLICLERCE
ncbi:class I SAM-dependent methyltransferase [Aeromicrobium phragmitis]|uniref:Class I SAM-dependent methyltransferase n=1 Tax=Aeromicrobium phragmitis TaxID=2478914 RepID=A0A3L8PQZ7_9ACTN|nr:class I SAM-dependent methyltransferase [Aeromicrobium phragmitis]